MNKNITFFILIFILFLSLSGCQSSEQTSETVINDEETFVIGVDENYPPLGFRNEQEELVGFDISLAQATADELGMKLEVVPIDWAEKEEILESGAIDAIWSGLTITPEREEIFSFTEPYLDVQPVLVVRDDSTIASSNDLVNKVIGVQEGSYAEQILESLPVYSEIDHVTPFEENISALKNLYVGLTDAVIVDSAVAGWYINSEDAEYKIVESLGDTVLGVAFSKDNEALRDQVNQALATLKENGTAQTLSEEWFGTNLIYNE